MSDRQSFLQGLAGKNPEDVKVRAATQAERRFLQRYNRVRVCRLLLFWGTIVLLLGIFASAHAVLLFMRDDPEPLGLVVMALLLLLVDFFAIKAWGPGVLRAMRIRPVLRVPGNVDVVEFRGLLYLTSHATGEQDNIFMAEQNPVDLPGHWEASLARRMSERGGRLRSRIAVAILPGASNEVIRLPVYSSPETGSRRRIDPVFTDFGNVVVAIDTMSVERDAQAGLPVLRANFVVFKLSFVLALIAAGLGLYLWIMHGIRAEDQAKQADERAQLASDVRQLEADYTGGVPVDLEGLRMRGIEGLRMMPGYDGKVVRSDAFDAATVELWFDGPRVLLLPEERRLVMKLAQVFPQIIPGYSRRSVSAKDIERYRLKLTTALGDATGPVRERIDAALQAMPDAVIQDQVRSQGLIRQPARSFAEALLPKPMIHLESDDIIVPGFATMSGFPQNLSAICTYAAAVLCEEVDGVEHHPAPLFVSQGDQLRLIPANGLETLRDKKAALDKAVALEKAMAERADSWLDALCAALASLAVLLGVFNFAAERRVRRFYALPEG